jgi:hypothetical protein
VIVLHPVADQPGNTVVRLGAGVHAGVAARAVVEVDEQKVLRLVESLVEKVVEL